MTVRYSNMDIIIENHLNYDVRHIKVWHMNLSSDRTELSRYSDCSD